ncbi:MAG: 1-deoxy-D-xylulose-5-phosphate synthase [Kosmotoga sp.]|nr:MAG: 1-deoxy-D-xylulose-5-phosphate synthase [Kosmotoga sp.]
MMDNCEEPLFKKLKKYSYTELSALADNFRDYIIKVVSKNSGHLASNLGTIELTIALYKVFDPSRDIIIWDTGHQAYTHKLLTGRYNSFNTLRQKGGISGFVKRGESKYDVFGTGHVGTGIPVALGIEKALEMDRDYRRIIVVVGDGALTSGSSLEALNQMSEMNSKIILVINDNGMSISKNVGLLSSKLDELRLNPFYREMKEEIRDSLETMKLKGIEQLLSNLKSGVKHAVLGRNIFEDFGLNYLGPVDGNRIKDLIDLFELVKKFDEPFVVHAVTKKGRGLDYAEEKPDAYHSVSKMDPDTGINIKDSNFVSYSEIFGKTLRELAKNDHRIIGITAAMPDGTGMNYFAEGFPGRFFDLGITEQLCTNFASGLAVRGFRPVFAVYSTFLQRAYDQVIHDVALQKLPVIFAVDRAGIVGNDGPTHNGIFDISFLNTIPNITLLAPSGLQELSDMLYSVLNMEKINGPIFIRYPRETKKGNPDEIISGMKKVDVFKWNKISEASAKKETVILAVGSMVDRVLPVSKKLDITMYNCRSIKPLDTEALEEIGRNYSHIITIEEGTRLGGFGNAVMNYLSDHGIIVSVLNIGIDDRFSEQGTREEVLRDLSLDCDSLERKIKELRGEFRVNNNRVR